MPDASERMFRRDIAALPEVFRFVAARIRALEVGESEAYWADLVVEELFTNMIKYSRNDRDVAIHVNRDADRLRIRLTDFDVEPFDITQHAPHVDPTQPIEQRTPGGLGLYRRAAQGTNPRTDRAPFCLERSG